MHTLSLSLSLCVFVYCHANPNSSIEISTWYQSKICDLDHCQGQDKNAQEDPSTKRVVATSGTGGSKSSYLGEEK